MLYGLAVPLICINEFIQQINHRLLVATLTNYRIDYRRVGGAQRQQSNVITLETEIKMSVTSTTITFGPLLLYEAVSETL
jgi:hypothetical protein